MRKVNLLNKSDMKPINNLSIWMLGIGILAFSFQCKQQDTMSTREPYKKKYTNADFYKDGKLDPEIALNAYLDMFEYYGVPYSDFVKENMFISDFSLGDFENVGMAGLFWVNDPEHKYFGHEIYLLPGQMIVEHKHVTTEFPPKFESWQMRHGWAYNFSVGEPSPAAPQLPASQKGHITVSHFKKQVSDEVLHLAEPESPHFLFAGPEGAIITEYATYHDGNGLRFTNPNVQFVDVLAKTR
jgi:D-lyxose ketol-isomerase